MAELDIYIPLFFIDVTKHTHKKTPTNCVFEIFWDFEFGEH